MEILIGLIILLIIIVVLGAIFRGMGDTAKAAANYKNMPNKEKKLRALGAAVLALFFVALYFWNKS